MRKLSDTLGALLIVAVVCALATGFFVAFAAPAVPRTVWGGAMALVLGLPLLLFVDVVFDYFLGVGVTSAGWKRHRRQQRGRPFVRWVAAFLICAAVVTAVQLVLSNVDFLRAHFR